MPLIQLETKIYASIERCFDFARSIDLHMVSTSHTKEVAIAARTKGLINLGETVTWEATHFGIRQKLTTKITALTWPFHFRAEQLKGAFKSLVHDHYFEKGDDYTVMADTFTYHSPYGLAGRFFNHIILTRYLETFLIRRNLEIKKHAEDKLRDIPFCSSPQA